MDAGAIVYRGVEDPLDAMPAATTDRLVRLRTRLQQAVDRAGTPGLQYLAVTADAVIADYAVGWADLQARRPMTPRTTLMAYSMSKTLTAVAALQLVQAGRLDLDAPARRHLPDGAYDGITVRQLLAHTAGVANPIPLRWVHPAASHTAFDEASALAATLRAYPRLAGTPGARYRYSNIGYWLLGEIVAHASGMPFTRFVAERLLQPLGVPPHELGYVVTDPAQHAAGYLERYSLMNLVKGWLVDRDLVGATAGRWVEIRPHYPNGPAFGGLVGSVRGFGRFLQDQLRPVSVLLDAKARAWLYEPQRTSAGRVVPMTLGWHVGALDGRRVFFKEGGGGGFHCLMRLYPDRGLGTVVMTNATGFDVTRLLDEVDRTWD